MIINLNYKPMKSNPKDFNSLEQRIIFTFMFICIFCGNSFAQNGFNPNSVRPIHESDIFYKKSIIRAIDLREKQNKPMFSRNQEITKIIMEAVENGKLTPYNNDSLSSVISIDQF